MAFDPSSRFSLVEQAVMLPGKCFITGTTTGKFVDTGMSINKFDGIFSEVNNPRVYISLDVIREMAEGAGLFEEMEARYKAIAYEEYAKGYSKGILESGELAGFADRLIDAAAIIRSSALSTGQEASGADSGDSPIVFVTDGPAKPGDGEGDNKRQAVGGQGNGSRGLRRPARLPSDSGNESAPVGVS